MEHTSRHATLAVAAVVALAFTLTSPVQPRQRTMVARPEAHVVTLARSPSSHWAIPIERGGRVVRWENDRLLAAEAAAEKAAAKPPAAIPSYLPGTIQDIITKAFAPLGATAVAWGLRVSRCESGLNPRAYNPAGPYYGLFQFAMPTFRATPYGGQDIFDPAANAGAAAWKYSRGGAGAWGCR
ncbi:MAG TPA: transglycosylase SLT domain-containing protein [Candidatus Dormibacteraeota bacterium]